MITNARMYSVDPAPGAAWRALFEVIVRRSGLPIDYIEHPFPAAINDLWQRPDKAAVFMCGLPYACATHRPELVAVPVPSPAAFRGLPQYWSEFVVRADSGFTHLEDTFGGRIAFTEPMSQSGCVAALHALMTQAQSFPPFAELIAPQITPLGVVQAVLDGRADVAPVDAYAWCLLQQSRTDLTSRLRIVGRTARTVIPPLVASQAVPAALQEAFLLAAQDAECRPLLDRLLLRGFVRLEPVAYDALAMNYAVTRTFWQAHALAGAIHAAFLV